MLASRGERAERPRYSDGRLLGVPAAFKVKAVNTGSWRLERPEVDLSLCNRCRTCAMFCPLQVITVSQAEFAIDFNFCKGCGICANECPKKALTMVHEPDLGGESK